MKKKLNRHIYKNLYLCYTLVFLFLFPIVFYSFIKYGKSFVWEIDGTYQHLNAYIYIGQWFRKIIKTLIFKGKLVIPMWEWTIGTGADVFNSLNYYVFFDPFSVLSVFFPLKYAVTGYTFSIILRYYFAGIAFCVFCRYMNCAKWSTLCGAIAYVFCSYSLYAGVKHPYFNNPAVYLPLLILACQMIFDKKSPLFLTGIVAICAISNFYFFYILVLLVVIYTVIKVVSEKIYKNKLYLFSCIGKLTAFSFLGVLISCFVFLPSLITLATTTRVSSGYEYAAFYKPFEYLKLIGSSISNMSSSDWAFIGVAPIAYLGVFSAYIRKESKIKFAKISLIVYFVFLCFPIFGHLFNGLGYVCNRWVFAWSFVVCYIFTNELPALLALSKKGKCGLFFGCLIYFVSCVILRNSRTEEVLLGCCFMTISFAVIVFFNFRIQNELYSKQKNIKYIKVAVVFLTALSVCLMGFYRFDALEGNYLSEFKDKGEGLSLLLEDREPTIREIDDNSFFRVDNSENNNNQSNFSLSLNRYTTAQYWSLIDKPIIDFYSLTNCYSEFSYRMKGLCSRAYLMPLFAVKYYVAAEIDKNIPYGYSKACPKGNHSDTYALYSTDNFLPFGYTYDSFFSEKDFNSLSDIKRQQVMLQSAVINKNSADGLTQKEPSFSDETIKYAFNNINKDVEINGKKIKVKSKYAKINLLFNPVTDGELYVKFTNLRFTPRHNNDYVSEDIKSNYSKFEKETIKNEQQNYIPATRANIVASSNDNKQLVAHFTNKNKAFINRKDYLINLGYSDKERNDISLYFSEIGEYTFDKLEVVCQKMDNYEQNINALKADTLENVKFDTNYVSGNINLETKKLLCLSMPYTPNWTAYVDGKEQKLIKTNIMFSGLMLEPGKHKIELKYSNRLAKYGTYISFAGIIIFCGVLLLNRRKKHFEKSDKK